jgi:cellulose biosynthesis protein BcsQ
MLDGDSMSTMEHSEEQGRKTEIIAFSSGKGGTGKTLIATCLGYALTKIGLRVLMIDSDTATDGLSLYLLGPGGVDKVKEFPLGSTLTGIMHQYKEQGNFQFKPWKINRSLQTDHGVIYEAIISGRQLYGDRFEASRDAATVQLDRDSYRKVIQTMFETLRERAEFDYVIVDTRGGFSNESTDVSALADSYIVVTEADVTSFYQNRNLIQYIDRSASDFGKKAILRSIIVNKSTQFTSTTSDFELDNLESSFRLQLEREFPIAYKDTYPFPLSLEALTVQKSQKIPLRDALDSDFSYAFLVAFHNILSVVTQPWTKEQVAEWNYLVESVNLAIQKRNDDLQRATLEEQQKDQELEKLRKENSDSVNRISSLERELKEIDERYQREIQRIESLSSKLAPEKVVVAAAPVSKPSTSSLRRWAPAILGILVVAAIAVFWAMTAGTFTIASAPSKTPAVTQPVTPIETQTFSATETITMTPPVQATNTLAPTATLTSVPVLCPQSEFDPLKVLFPLAAKFVADITIPDGTVLSPGQGFVKTWYIQNIGGKDIIWNAKYSIVSYGGDPMGADKITPFPDQDVAPGECVEISLKMTAPSIPNEYKGLWIFRETNGVTTFGLVDAAQKDNQLPLTVVIKVQAPSTSSSASP